MGALYVPIRRSVYLSVGLVDKLFGFKKPLVHILCYHSLNIDSWDFSINPEDFKKQINFLKTQYEFITLSDLSKYIDGEIEIKKPSVIINFDDGYQDIMQVKGFLKDFKIKPTVFVLANTKNPNYKELGTKRKFLSISEILELKKDGWEIGSHTSTHSDMHSLNDKQIQYEIADSKKILEKELKIPIKYIAFPKGRYNNRTNKVVKNSKYELALTMDDGTINKLTNKLLVPRIGVDRTHSFGEFKTLSSTINIAARKFIKALNYGK